MKNRELKLTARYKSIILENAKNYNKPHKFCKNDSYTEHVHYYVNKYFYKYNNWICCILFLYNRDRPSQYEFSFKNCKKVGWSNH